MFMEADEMRIFDQALHRLIVKSEMASNSVARANNALTSSIMGASL